MIQTVGGGLSYPSPSLVHCEGAHPGQGEGGSIQLKCRLEKTMTSIGGEKRAPKMDKKRKERKRKNRSIMTKKGFRNDISLSFFSRCFSGVFWKQ